jgi:single-stranded-DNA-specific exonuclease
VRVAGAKEEYHTLMKQFSRRDNQVSAQTVWDVSCPAPQKVAALSAALGIPSLLSRVLVSRGLDEVTAARRFLEPSLEDICDAFLLKDIEKAVDRIAYALEQNQRICIYGDYDADGITATALLVRFFRWLGKDVHYYIPHRLSEGYGLNLAAVKRLLRERYQLLITVDNGISSLEEVAYAQSHGMDVIVTDHHQCGGVLPEAFAVLDPARPDCPYPFSMLSGVGVAFKLLQALVRRLGIDPRAADEFLGEHLALVALGTIADIVPLQDENRVLANFGLQRLQNCRNIGIATALRLAGTRQRRVTSQVVAFALAPRLNAAGRTEHASLGVELLLTDSEPEATALARRLNRLNEDRRSIEQEIYAESLKLIEREMMVERQRVLIVHGEGWHAGVTGIVAARIMEYFNRPVIVFSVDKDVAKGSARSIERYNIHDALVSCSDLLLSFGGHMRAAGLRIYTKNLEPFSRLINSHAEESLSADDLLPRLRVDAEVTPQELTTKAVASLEQLEPFGTANLRPVFLLRGVHLLERPRVVGTNHLKMELFKDEAAFSTIGFSLGHCVEMLDDEHCSLDIVFSPFISDYYGYDSVELELKDLRVNR